MNTSNGYKCFVYLFIKTYYIISNFMIQENKVLNETNYGKYVCIWIGTTGGCGNNVNIGLIFINWHSWELLCGYTVFRMYLLIFFVSNLYISCQSFSFIYFSSHLVCFQQFVIGLK